MPDPPEISDQAKEKIKNIMASTGQSNQKFVKVNLPEFYINDPETWFAAADHIFTANAIISEDDKFSYLLQSVGNEQLVNIGDILRKTSTTKYSEAKQKLIQLHGTSQHEKLQRLLAGVDIPPNLKPSLILARLRTYGGPEVAVGHEELIRGIWLQKLPTRTKEFLAVNKGSLEEQCRMADNLFETYEVNSVSTVSAIGGGSMQETAGSNSSDKSGQVFSSSQFDVLVSLLTNLTAHVTAVHTERQSRSRRATPYHSRSNSRANSQGRGPRHTQIKNGKCWYHFKFQDNARICVPGCVEYNNFYANKGN